MAITLELGDADDIHPKNKMPVGDRLAQSALAITYGAGVTAAGPILDRVEIEGSQVLCIFRNADSGLMTMDKALPRTFFVAGVIASFIRPRPRSREISLPRAVRRLASLSLCGTLGPTTPRRLTSVTPQVCQRVHFRTDSW